jgi:hypothetical protein
MSLSLHCLIVDTWTPLVAHHRSCACFVVCTPHSSTSRCWQLAADCERITATQCKWQSVLCMPRRATSLQDAFLVTLCWSCPILFVIVATIVVISQVGQRRIDVVSIDLQVVTKHVNSASRGLGGAVCWHAERGGGGTNRKGDLQGCR